MPIKNAGGIKRAPQDTWLILLLLAIFFFTLLFIFLGQENQFCASSQTFFYRRSRISVTFRSTLSSYKILGGGGRIGWRYFFPVVAFRDEYFSEKMSSIADLNKKLSNFLLRYHALPFLIFDY